MEKRAVKIDEKRIMQEHRDGLTASDIAHKEKLPVLVVRMILEQSREEAGHEESEEADKGSETQDT